MLCIHLFVSFLYARILHRCNLKGYPQIMMLWRRLLYTIYLTFSPYTYGYLQIKTCFGQWQKKSTFHAKIIHWPVSILYFLFKDVHVVNKVSSFMSNPVYTFVRCFFKLWLYKCTHLDLDNACAILNFKL